MKDFDEVDIELNTCMLEQIEDVKDRRIGVEGMEQTVDQLYGL